MDDALKIFLSSVKHVDPERLVTSSLKLNRSGSSANARPTLEVWSTLSSSETKELPASTDKGDANPNSSFSETSSSRSHCVASYDLSRYRRVVVVGAGKATVAMARAAEAVLANFIDDGLIITKYDHYDAKHPLSKVKVIEAAHPVTDEKGVNGTKQMLRLLEDAEEDTLVLCLISGGGSALLCAPPTPLTLADIRALNQTLLECGATIHDINAIRKQVDRIKGGGLARAAYPATVLSLILSDVVGDPLDIIASGPTVQDSGSPSECLVIMEKFHIADKVPESILQWLKQRVESHDGQTSPSPSPRPNDADVFARVRNVVVGSNVVAVNQAQHTAKQLGYHTMVLTTRLEGEAKEVAKVLVSIAKEIHSHNRPLPKPACLIAGGETTVTIQGKGKGGRNQELALAALSLLKGSGSEVCVLSGGTDGSDGPTDATGAVVDGSMLKEAEDKHLNVTAYLQNNDAYHFFQKLGRGLIITGSTGTNVMDVIVVIVK